jgi:siroheme synthase-like protein
VSNGISQNIYPMSLLLKKRPCLVVGGGKVATRKIEGLLDADADVTVVSPALDETLAQLAAAGTITHISRPYEPGDTKGHVLVFAATGDRKVNRTVLEECRNQRIPCCPVDGNWMDGDFVTPATIRKGSLSVAISTGGQNCRRSRLIKENLARHLCMVDSADLVVIGTSHQELTLPQRDALQLRGERLEHIGNMLLHVWGLHEFMLVSTCNRMELHAVKAIDAETDAVLQRILGFDALPPEALYVKTGIAAFEHTAMLAAGLLSQATGEYHIVAQLKNALELATRKEWAGGMIKEWTDATLHISKDIRQALPHEWMQGEIEDVAIQYLQKAAPRFPQPSTIPPQPSTVVIGTGAIGTGIVERLNRLGIPCHWIYHRNAPAAVPASATVHPWRERHDLLARSTHVITAVSAPDPIITTQMQERFAGRNVLLLDLATPRNIESAIAKTNPQIQRVDLDTLKAWQAKDSGMWHKIWGESLQITQAHRNLYHQIMRSFQQAM